MQYADKLNMEKLPFWNRVEELRKRFEVTQDELASCAEVGVATYRNWISRGLYPNADQSYKIATKLCTSVEYLVDGIEPNVPDHSAEVIKAIEKALEPFR